MKSIAKFGIPAQALAIAVTTLGCESEDPMIGDFVCSFYAYDGDRTDCPDTDTTTVGGVTTETFQSFELSVRADGSGALYRITEVEVDGTLDTAASSVEDFNITGTQISEGEWNLDIPTFYGLNLECSAELTIATCLGEDVDQKLWEFNWSPLGTADIL